MTERDLLRSTLTPDYLRSIDAAQVDLDRFCAALRVPCCLETVTIYLTWLSEEPDISAHDLQRVVDRLDAAMRLAGAPPWRSAAQYRRFVRGLFRVNPIGATVPMAEPLYVELVSLLVQATMEPTPNQQRQRTAIALHHATSLTASALVRLRWRDIRFRRQAIDFYAPLLPERATKPRLITLTMEGPTAIAARELRHLHDVTSSRNQNVFAEDDVPWGRMRAGNAIKVMNDRSGDVNQALADVSRSAQQLRDRALFLLGYGAALRSQEAITLTQADVSVDPRGLLLRIDGRLGITAIPSNPGEPTDPVRAWVDWSQFLSDRGRGDPARPAFPVLNRDPVWARTLTRKCLNELIQRACARADLTGHYAFHSLRSGLIRSAVRANGQTADIAAHSDLRTLRAVRLHQHRERLLSHSVAGQLGL